MSTYYKRVNTSVMQQTELWVEEDGLYKILGWIDHGRYVSGGRRGWYLSPHVIGKTKSIKPISKEEAFLMAL